MPVTVNPSAYNLPVIPREDLEQDAEKLFEIAPRTMFIATSGAVLATSGSGSDCGFIQGTHGTHFPYVGTSDFKTTNVTRSARFTFVLPPEYVPDGALLVRLKAGMVTTVCGTSCEIDAVAYKAHATTGNLKTGSDLVTTAAQSINSLTWADKDFAIDGTGLVPGDELDILITITGVDTGSGSVTAVIGGFRAFVGCTIRG